MAEESKASVIGAITANFAIAAAKLLAALLGKSSAMISEAIHSGVDGINDLLLLFGLKQSKKPADEQHPFGYGKELYFWSLIVSCSVLAIGGGVTVVEGIRRLLKPERVEHAGWAYLALACGAAFEAGSLIYSIRQFRKQNEGKGMREAIRETKDPGSLMVVLEDSAGFLGEIIAAAGIFLNGHGWERGDGAASVLIGCVLGVMAIYLIGQTRDLVVGEGVEDDISRSIREMATGEGKFLCVRGAHTMHFGPETVLVTMEAEFDPQRPSGELMEAVDRIQRSIRDKFPAVKFIYLDPEAPKNNGTAHETG
jgi:cation diffusion facilitator family transporter